MDNPNYQFIDFFKGTNIDLLSTLWQVVGQNTFFFFTGIIPGPINQNYVIFTDGYQHRSVFLLSQSDQSLWFHDVPTGEVFRFVPGLESCSLISSEMNLTLVIQPIESLEELLNLPVRT